MFDTSLAPAAPTLAQRLAVPNRWSNLNQSFGAMNDMMAQRYQAGQQLQLSQAQQLSNAQAMYMAYTGERNPNIDSLLSQNPYGKFIMPQGSQGLSGVGTPQPMSNPVAGTLFGMQPSQAMAASGNMPMSMGMPGFGGNSATNVPPSTDNSTPSGISGGSMSNVNPVSGPVTTQMTSKFQPYMGMMPETSTTINPTGEEVAAQARAQGSANVSVPTEYSTKMMGAQALAAENQVRDKTQMDAVFKTLQNLTKLHSDLATKNLAGTDLGDLALDNLGHVGTAAAIMGQSPVGAQRALVSQQDQEKLGAFQAGRNEGITRAIQPLQNQVDKTGSNRIMDSLLEMTQGEYGKLDDPHDVFVGKTKGTAATLYRINLASQEYADLLRAKGVKVNSSDSNFNPDQIAQSIFDRSKTIALSPAEQSELDGYTNQILGTKGNTKTNTPSGSMNPVINQGSRVGQQRSKQLDQDTARQILQQAGGDKNKARQMAQQMGYSF